MPVTRYDDLAVIGAFLARRDEPGLTPAASARLRRAHPDLTRDLAR